MSKKAAKTHVEETEEPQTISVVGIKETEEAFDALASIAAKAINNLADGTLTWSEKVSFATELPAVYRALNGCTHIPAELADLDKAEEEELLERIGSALVSVGLSHRVGDASQDILRWVYTTIHTFLKIKDAPPSAIAA